MARATVACLSRELGAGRITSRQLVEQALQRIEDPKGEGSRVFMKVHGELARKQAEASDALRAAGVVRSPVEGIPVSVKDLFDVAGDVTMAGSKVLSNADPAKRDALTIARLRAAGAIIVGRTTTVEFAFGGVGTNPHYGTPKNPFDRENGGRIPGGSSAGAAVSVADGMVCMGLGTDTRGSVRIPSALCGTTGFKPTASRIPKHGVFPLSYTLDSVGPLANSVACCAVYDAILAGEEASVVTAPAPLPLASLHFIIPVCSLLDGLDPQVSQAFERSIDTLRTAGASIERVPMPMLTDAQNLYKNGGFAGAEAYQIHRALLEKSRDDYDPRVAARIALGESFPAADYIQLGLDREKLIDEIRALVRPFDAMLFPTVPIVAPSIVDAQKSDEDYVSLNMKLLRNPGLINLLNGCALSIPCHKPGEEPVGLMIAGMGGSDKHILAVGQSVEDALSIVTDSARHTEPLAKRARM